MQHEMSRYLFTATTINTLVGIGATAIAFFAGIPDPLLWGVMALLLNFIPYFGPLCMTLLFVRQAGSQRSTCLTRYSLKYSPVIL